MSQFVNIEDYDASVHRSWVFASAASALSDWW